MKNKIYFANKQNYMVVTAELKNLIHRAVDATLSYEGVREKCEISLTFTDDETIHALNKKHRDVDRATDVLSFPLLECAYAEYGHGDELLELGDIVISVQTAAAQARELGHSLPREIAFLCIHSVLHLLGYDHTRSEEDDEDTCRRQRDIIKILDI